MSHQKASHSEVPGRLMPQRKCGLVGSGEGVGGRYAVGGQVEVCGYAGALCQSGIGRTGGDCAVLGKEGDGIPHTRGIRTPYLAGMAFLSLGRYTSVDRFFKRIFPITEFS